HGSQGRHRDRILSANVGVDERAGPRHACGMRRRLGLVFAVLLGAPSVFAAGGAAPSAERIKSAAAEYDAGRRAFTDQKFEEAAIHFENAYHDAPNAQTLRNAIRARREAKQLARAATLAVIAQERYADDDATVKFAKETL